MQSVKIGTSKFVATNLTAGYIEIGHRISETSDTYGKSHVCKTFHCKRGVCRTSIDPTNRGPTWAGLTIAFSFSSAMCTSPARK